jgi:hypothetical protein
VAAARLPPKSIEAVPESVEWIIEMASEFTMNATMTASMLGARHTTARLPICGAQPMKATGGRRWPKTLSEA